MAWQFSRAMVRGVFGGPGFVLLLAGCGSSAPDESPPDVAGEYTLLLANGEDACGLPDWMRGETSRDVHMTMSQSGRDVVAELTDAGPALVLWSLTGSAEFRGIVVGDALSLNITGSTRHTQEEDVACEFWIDASLSADVDERGLAGEIVYTLRTVPGATCVFGDTCPVTQTLSGVRGGS